ncbi:MAG: holo-ACP synthase [Clostridia bacterium]|jgi:holo-[acyl-carrier protein] synthase|nr:holo-ACP synthase [Clostridia bacterium]MBT7122107.1 holo-ACP synthase [Clostridia bacterium]
MIIGTGLDLIEVKRIKKAMQTELFFTKNFTGDEIAMFESRKSNPEVVAGNFAAKEAVLKCLGYGLFDMPLIDIEVLRKESGEPYIILHGKAKLLAQEIGAEHIHISITHIAEFAAAQAIAEGSAYDQSSI